MVRDLSILCITAMEPHGEEFREEMAVVADELDAHYVEFDGRGAGILEHVQDQAVAMCPEGYVLLLADDERCSDAMIDWLGWREYRTADNWAFPRAHLWESRDRYIFDDPLWPDLQTRLATKAKSGGRNQVHQGSPFGTGQLAPVAIEHHKFLVRTREELEQILARYVELDPRSGSAHYRAFSLPQPRHICAWDSEAFVEQQSTAALSGTTGRK